MKKISLLYCLLILVLCGCGVGEIPTTGYKIPFLHQNKVHFLNEMTEKKEYVKGWKKTWIAFDMNASETVYVDNEGIMTYLSNGIKESIQKSDRTMGVLVRNQIVYSIDQQKDRYEITVYRMNNKLFDNTYSVTRQGNFLSWNFVEDSLLISEYQEELDCTRVIKIDSNFDVQVIREINGYSEIYPMYIDNLIFIYSINHQEKNELIIWNGTEEVKTENLSFLSCKSVLMGDSLYIITSNGKSNLFRLDLETYQLSLEKESNDEYQGLYYINDDMILISDQNIIINDEVKANIKNKEMYIKYN
ncbi:MAG: hypothetical protein RR565_06850 [Erysipelothrix sp.]